MTFAEWIDFEAARIVSMGLRLQIQAARKKAFHDGQDGLTENG